MDRPPSCPPDMSIPPWNAAAPGRVGHPRPRPYGAGPAGLFVPATNRVLLRLREGRIADVNLTGDLGISQVGATVDLWPASPVVLNPEQRAFDDRITQVQW